MKHMCRYVVIIGPHSFMGMINSLLSLLAASSHLACISGLNLSRLKVPIMDEIFCSVAVILPQVICVDGVEFIAARDYVGEIGQSKDARVFYMVRAEPPDEMELLYETYPSAGISLWDGEQRIHVFSTKPSESLHEKVQPWDIQLFHDWNPLRSTV
jgi:hypothetical protein